MSRSWIMSQHSRVRQLWNKTYRPPGRSFASFSHRRMPGFEVVNEGQPDMLVCGQGVKASARLGTSWLSAIVGDHEKDP